MFDIGLAGIDDRRSGNGLPPAGIDSFIEDRHLALGGIQSGLGRFLIGYSLVELSFCNDMVVIEIFKPLIVLGSFPQPNLLLFDIRLLYGKIRLGLRDNGANGGGILLSCSLSSQCLVELDLIVTVIKNDKGVACVYRLIVFKADIRYIT